MYYTDKTRQMFFKNDQDQNLEFPLLLQKAAAFWKFSLLAFTPLGGKPLTLLLLVLLEAGVLSFAMKACVLRVSDGDGER